MKTFTSNFLILILSLLSFYSLHAQGNPDEDCPAPEDFFIGEYFVQDINATIGPNNGTTNFQPGVVTVTGEGNLRLFQNQMYPLFNQNLIDVGVLLNCGTLFLTQTSTGIGCGQGDIQFFQDGGNLTPYDFSTDLYFQINYLEDVFGSCGGAFASSFEMTKLCSMPQNITFNNATFNSVEVNWLDTNNMGTYNNTYTIEYGPEGFAPGNGTIISGITTTNYLIDTLQPNITYDFYISGNCTAGPQGTQSQVAGPFKHGAFLNGNFSLDANGTTCLCPNANFGESGSLDINGELITFTKRSEDQLRDLIDADENDPRIARTCTSGITDMSDFFLSKSVFNQNIQSWDVSSVVTMFRMFNGATNFNQPLELWDVANVTTMANMFFNASSFNQPLNAWDVSSLTDMGSMFTLAASFNQPLNNWNVSGVTNMFQTFAAASSFNQPLNNWDVANVTNMTSLFLGATVFNQNIDSWNVGNVLSMNSMFQGFGGNINTFNQPINSWNVSNVTTMAAMFFNSEFNEPLDNWDVSNVTSMSSMFDENSVFNQDLSNWVFNQNVSLNNFVSNTGLDSTNYDNLLQSFDNQNLTDKDLGANNLAYCDLTSRNNLINNKNWTIVGDFQGQCGTVSNPSSTPFVTTWDVQADDLTIDIFTTNAYIYDFNIDWGDGTSNQNVNSTITHTYNAPGNYIVSISGIFPYFKTCENSNNLDFPSSCSNSNKLASVVSWGDQQWRNMFASFANSPNLILSTTQAPDLSLVENMDYAFAFCTNFNQDINGWNVSSIKSMRGTFSGATVFDQALSNWDVSNVANMESLFNACENFNQSIDNWNVSNVVNMSSLFQGALVFNQALNSWDVSNVTDMSEMFAGAAFYNQPLNSWNVANVQNMRSMFNTAFAFNQALSNWNVSNVQDMAFMFNGAQNFNQLIDMWVTSSVTNMSYMFSGTSNFDSALNSWDVSNVQFINDMFNNATGFNQSLSNWDTSSVIFMDRMFFNALSYNQDISTWCVENLLLEPFDFSINAPLQDDFKPNWGAVCETNFNPDFTLASDGLTCLCPNADFGDTGTLTINGEQLTFTKRTEQDLRGIIENAITSEQIRLTCTSGITDMSSLFEGQTTFDQNLQHWDVGSVTDMSQMFYQTNTYNQPMNNWDVSNVTTMSFMFAFTGAFNQPLDNWDVSSVNTMDSVFAVSQFNQDIGSWDVSNVLNMRQLFAGTPFNQPLDSWDVSSVTNMDRMFSFASAFNQPLNNWNVSSVTSMFQMFNSTAFNQVLNNWDVSQVTNMQNMFNNAQFNQDISNWNVGNVLNMQAMFANSQYNFPLNDWEVSNVANMNFMFFNSQYNQPLDNWSVNSVQSMDSMFADSNFNEDISGWCVEQIEVEPTDFVLNAPIPSSFLPSWGVSCNIPNVDFVLADDNVTCLCPDAEIGDVGTLLIDGQLVTFTKRSETALRNLIIANTGNPQIALTCTSAITDMSFLFNNELNFDQTLEHWDVSNVTNMESMFENAGLFNSPLSEEENSENYETFNLDINNWDVSNVTNMDRMFKNAFSYNQDLSDWCVELIPTEPVEFSLNSPLQDSFKPNWGATCTLGLDTPMALEWFSTYPNPVDTQLYFEWNRNIKVQELTIQIFDINGKQVYYRNLKERPESINLSNLLAGFYFLKVNSEKNTVVKRLLKK